MKVLAESGHLLLSFVTERPLLWALSKYTDLQASVRANWPPLVSFIVSGVPVKAARQVVTVPVSGGPG